MVSPHQQSVVTLDLSLFPCQQQEPEGELQAEETKESERSEELRGEDFGTSVFWWLWDAFLQGASPEVNTEGFSGNFCLP